MIEGIYIYTQGKMVLTFTKSKWPMFPPYVIMVYTSSPNFSTTKNVAICFTDTIYTAYYNNFL